MDAWREEGFGELLSVKTEQELFKRMSDMAAAMGFEYCAYGVQLPVPISRPNVVMFNNYSDSWRECYTARGYIAIDPTVQHARKSNFPVVWSNKLFESAQDMWEEACGHGLRVGWGQAVRDASGCVGLLTLARSAEQLTAGELYANQAKMTWLAQYAHAAMVQILTPKMLPETQVVMTAREKEVLRWSAEGKTAFEISLILGISERTINFHITNAVVKLGAANKTQAVVKAVALGMFS